jgi:hypothetical protein
MGLTLWAKQQITFEFSIPEASTLSPQAGNSLKKKFSIYTERKIPNQSTARP